MRNAAGSRCISVAWTVSGGFHVWRSDFTVLPKVIGPSYMRIFQHDANRLPPQTEALIVRCKQDKPHWGARKIRELLVRRRPGDLRVPARSTILATTR